MAFVKTNPMIKTFSRRRNNDNTKTGRGILSTNSLKKEVTSAVRNKLETVVTELSVVNKSPRISENMTSRR